MFQAILHGKVRDNFASADLDSDWRSLYRQTEDFLTGAVFCRLSYLPPDVLWSIIHSAAIITAPTSLPDCSGDLLDREFWPRWSSILTDDEQLVKEPDVFFLFQRLCLLVEAKADDNYKQYAEQWASEIAAYLAQEGFDHALPVWLLAIGGLGDEPTVLTVLKMREEAERILHAKYNRRETPVRLAACSWRQLLAALVERGRQGAASSGIIIHDLIEILRFHGFRHAEWLADLTGFTELCQIQDRSLAIWTRTTPR